MKFDYLFISSSEPSPVMIERINIATSNGFNPLYICWDRNTFYLKDQVLNFKKLSYPIGQTKSFYLRIYNVIKFSFWLFKLLRKEKISSVNVFCDSFDLLFIISLFKKSFNFYIRYSIEDLNEYQLNKNLLSSIFKLVEKYLLLSVDFLILTSQEFYDRYYINLYQREYIVVENVPNRLIWQNFNKPNSNIKKFVIAFIGIIRYYKCLTALIDASAVLNEQGYELEVRFYGGGQDYEMLLDYGKNYDFIKFHGPYNYNLEIKEIYSFVDLIYSVYDYDIQNVRLAMPNKFYESIITKIPILVSKNTYLEKRVIEAGIGIGVDYKNKIQMVNILKDAILNRGWYCSANKIILESDLEKFYFETHKDAFAVSIV